MSNDDSVRFKGRTYSRRKNATPEGSTVQVKAAVSLSKWGKTNYVPYREEAETKKANVVSEEDPFRFDSEDKSKSPVKRHVQGERSTLLPASRIVTSGKHEDDVKAEIDKLKQDSSAHTYSRLSMKEECEEPPVKVGRGVTGVNKDGEIVFLPIKKDSDEDDIFPVEFKREPLKNYAGEVITPVVKPESPPLKKGRYIRKGGQRGRKPLTVSDPALIEQYKKNYAAQQKKEKKDTDVGGLNNSMVVSKQELSNEDQGKLVVVVCKPKNVIEKGDVQTKYFSRAPRKVGLTILETDTASSQETGKTNTLSSPDSARDGQKAQTSGNKLIKSGESLSTPSPSVTTTFTRRITRGKLSGGDWTSPSSTTSNNSASQSESSGGRSGKRYRIFKTRAQPESEPSTPSSAVQEAEDTESPFPVSQSESLMETDNQQSQSIEEPNGENEEIFDALRETPEKEVPSKEETVVAQIEELKEEMDVEQAPASQALTTCVKNLTTRLKENEKDNESDSTEQDNASECSEILLSQESPANSQSTEEKESEAPRRFFKSKKSLSNSSDMKRKLLGGSPQKSPAKATYNARLWQNDDDEDDKVESLESMRRLRRDKDDMVLVRDSSKAPRLSREVHWPERKYDEAYTSLKVNKKHKELYTVVHNVKQTHEVQELGETQDFIDEVNYLLDSLRNSNSISIRCLSCLKLAGKCIMPAFRMHLRAHGTVTKIFSLLSDACHDPCLALSTSAMMFMLSRDRLNMDLDKDSLNLMLKLNEVDTSDKGKLTQSTTRELAKIKEKVKELLAQLQQETHAREIDLDFVSTGNLAMESLLSLTSRRAGEWFKEELRSVGGLDHIVDSVALSERMLVEELEDDIQSYLPSLRKLDRCLRVLENVSFMNTDNKMHLVTYKKGAVLTSCGRVLRLCQKCMPSFKVLETVEENKCVKDLPGFTIYTTMMAVLRLLLNITHDHGKGESVHNITRDRDFIETGLTCLINTQWCIPIEQRFDLSVLCLGLLINLVEGREENRVSLMETDIEVCDRKLTKSKKMSAVQAIVKVFCQREEAAREMEETSEGVAADTSVSSNDSPNKSGEWKETEVGIQWITNNFKKAKEEQEKQEKANVESGEAGESAEGNQSILEDDEETFTKALHKAGKHMENSIVASYAGLLLGSIMTDNSEYVAIVKELIPNEDFRPMIKILKKFLNFMSLTTAFGTTDVNGITKLISVLEAA